MNTSAFRNKALALVLLFGAPISCKKDPAIDLSRLPQLPTHEMPTMPLKDMAVGSGELLIDGVRHEVLSGDVLPSEKGTAVQVKLKLDDDSTIALDFKSLRPGAHFSGPTHDDVAVMFFPSEGSPFHSPSKGALSEDEARNAKSHFWARLQGPRASTFWADLGGILQRPGPNPEAPPDTRVIEGRVAFLDPAEILERQATDLSDVFDPVLLKTRLAKQTPAPRTALPTLEIVPELKGYPKLFPGTSGRAVIKLGKQRIDAQAADVKFTLEGADMHATFSARNGAALSVVLRDLQPGRHATSGIEGPIRLKAQRRDDASQLYVPTADGQQSLLLYGPVEGLYYGDIEADMELANPKTVFKQQPVKLLGKIVFRAPEALPQRMVRWPLAEEDKPTKIFRLSDSAVARVVYEFDGKHIEGIANNESLHFDPQAEHPYVLSFVGTPYALELQLPPLQEGVYVWKPPQEGVLLAVIDPNAPESEAAELPEAEPQGGKAAALQRLEEIQNTLERAMELFYVVAPHPESYVVLTLMRVDDRMYVAEFAGQLGHAEQTTGALRQLRGRLVFRRP